MRGAPVGRIKDLGAMNHMQTGQRVEGPSPRTFSSVKHMTASPRSKKALPAGPVRRKRGTPVVGIQVDLSAEAKAILDEYTAATKCPQWAVLEAMLKASKKAPHGPLGFPEDWELPVRLRPVPFDFSADGGESTRRTA